MDIQLLSGIVNRIIKFLSLSMIIFCGIFRLVFDEYNQMSLYINLCSIIFPIVSLLLDLFLPICFNDINDIQFCTPLVFEIAYEEDYHFNTIEEMVVTLPEAVAIWISIFNIFISYNKIEVINIVAGIVYFYALCGLFASLINFCDIYFFKKLILFSTLIFIADSVAAVVLLVVFKNIGRLEV